MFLRVSALIAACFVTVACAKLVDSKSTDTPTNKDAQLPFVKAPDAEFGINKTGVVKSTTYCAPNPDKSYPTDTKMSGGETSDSANGRYYFAEGGGCILRPIRDAWGASMNQDLMVWTEPGNSGTFTTPPPPTGVSRFFDVEYTHVERGLGITVHWNMTWYHTILAGTPAAPQKILINFRRYKGTKYIKYWEGSIILTKISDAVTGIWIRNQINAKRVTEINARGGATDIIAKLRTGAPATDFLP